VAFRIERRRRYKEERLSFDEFPDGIVNRQIDVPHENHSFASS
jgi:hypothetical protein